MTIRFVINELPNFCPECGKNLHVKGKYFTERQEYFNLQKQDFITGASFECKCGTTYQRVPENEITELASKHGDAGQYWQ